MTKRFVYTVLCVVLATCVAVADVDAFQPDSFVVEYIADDDGDDNSYRISSLGTVDLTTDKAIYTPGETVKFTASTLPTGAKVRYRHLSSVVEVHDLTATEWTWDAPAIDFRGYKVDIFLPMKDGEVVYGSIAVDVSSDWTKYPRYGFLASFGKDKTKSVIDNEMAFLNRCHINAVQFQDWHCKHHWPLGGTRDNPQAVYTTISNDYVYADVVKNYIAAQHKLGMKSMFYNLCYGALKDAQTDGVSDRWFVFNDRNRNNRDAHILPQGWKSDIFLVNVGNTDWQKYMIDRNDDVYHNFDFDGYHVDQLGNRGEKYDYYGNVINFPSGYRSFLKAMKQAHPDKRLVMNSVGEFGQSDIAGSGAVDAAYCEMWGGELGFSDLRRFIENNDRYSNYSLRTVFAAYVNFGKSGGYFNTPGVLLTDATMMALGASHIELGDHMLCREYFPDRSLEMSPELRRAIIDYYDFATAYEELLAGTSTRNEISPGVSYVGNDKSLTFNYWPPQKGRVTCYARQAGSREVIHLLNYITADQLLWRDEHGTMPAPRSVSGIKLSVENKVPGGTVKNVWVASPDYHCGVMQPLDFTVDGNSIIFTVPNLKYWTMIVIE